MKIVQIGGFLIGAQKTIEINIHEYLCKHDCESYVFYQYGKENIKNIECYENKIENILTRVLRKLFGKERCFTLFQTIKLIRKIKRIQPDIIHLHVLHDGCVDYKILFEYIIRNRISVIYTMHDLWALTGGCYHYSKNNCQRYLNACRECMASEDDLDCKRKRVHREYEIKKNLLLAIPHYTSVAVSQWVKDEIKKSYLAYKNIQVIHNCVDKVNCQTIEQYPVPPRSKKYRLISIAQTWDDKKGIHGLFDLAEMLENDYEILLVGDINVDIKENAPHNIIFYGYCRDKNQIYSLLSDADLNVCMSKEETFGMTLVEAAIMGTRSIGFNSTAIKEILTLTKGTIVSEPTVEAMINEIKTIMQNNKSKLSEDEKEGIIKYFSSDRMAKQYYKLYCEVYNRKLND